MKFLTWSFGIWKEILGQKTSQGKFVYKHYKKINELYDEILKEALKTKPEGKIVVFVYTDAKISLTKESRFMHLQQFFKFVILFKKELS